MADRAEQVRKVLELVEGGMSENAACKEAGINRATFRAAALRVSAGDNYARALEALAADQVEKAEQVIEDMRAGVIDAAQARVELDVRKWFASKFLAQAIRRQGRGRAFRQCRTNRQRGALWRR
jgi:DNA-binding NarL/FixJ family response regulator